jgi:hypothetical protein
MIKITINIKKYRKFFLYILIYNKISNNFILTRNNLKIDFYNIQNISSSRKKYICHQILNGYMLYAHLWQDELNDQDIMDLCKEIYSKYRFFNICEKALIVGIWKLSIQKHDIKQIQELQQYLMETFPKSPYLNFTYIIIINNYILGMKDIIKNNFYTINLIISLLPNIKNIKYKEMIFFLVNYFYSEYLLQIAKECFQKKNFVLSVSYLQRVIIRTNIHPKTTLEALLLLIEIFCILNNQDLIKKYLNILENISFQYKELKIFYTRALYIVQEYNK